MIKEKASLNPIKLIDYFYDNIKLGTATIVVFLAVIIECILLSIIGFSNIGNYFLARLVSSIIFSWLLLGIILYLMAYIIKGKKKMKKKTFEKILSGLASFRIINIFALLFSFLISLVFVPELLSYIKHIAINPNLLYSSTALPVITGWGTLGLILLYIISILLIIYWVIMIYRLFGKIYDTKSFWSRILLIIIFIIILIVIRYLVNLL